MGSGFGLKTLGIRVSTRNQKARGLKVKQSIGIFLLIAIFAWLLYQVKHSLYKKTALEEMNLKDTNKVLELHREMFRTSRKGLRGRKTSSANDVWDGSEEIGVVTDEEQELKGPQDGPINADERGSDEENIESMDEKQNGIVILVNAAVDASMGEPYNSRTVNEDIDNVYGINLTENETMLMESMPEGSRNQMQQQSNLTTISLENEASNKDSAQYHTAIEEMGNDDEEEDMVVEETAKLNATAGVEIEEREVEHDNTVATHGESDLSTLADGVSQNSTKSCEEEAVEL